MNFSNITEWRIFEGLVTKVTDSQNRTIWDGGGQPQHDYSKDYFTIEDRSGESNTLTIKKSGTSTNIPTIEVFYSTDQTNWTSMGSTSSSGITYTIPANGKVYLKATTTKWGASQTYYNTINCSGTFNVSGNILSIVYGDDFTNHTTMPLNQYEFNSLFKNSTIVNSNNLVLPSNTYNNCYYNMFYGCTNLITAPTLSAFSLNTACYSGMFNGCTGLTTAPALPATTLASYCYNNMFKNCTNLTSTPTLSATTLATYCYDSMFSGCTGLTSTPNLLVTNIPGYAYQYMFSGCTGLTTVNTISATSLNSYSCRNMFQGCTGLTNIPNITFTSVDTYSCYNMFSGCTSLTNTPTLSATTLATYCYRGMFNGCTGLTTAPALPATTLATNCYEYMFYGCTSLTTAPALPATTLATSCYQSMFNGCTGLTTAPALPATTLATSCYSHMFSGCTLLNYVNISADDISASNCLLEWLKDVSNSGDFYNNSYLANYQVDSPSGIPTGWTEHKTATAPYFYVEDLSGSANTLSIVNDGAPAIEVFYSTDQTNWASMGTTSTTPITLQIPANDRVYLKANTDYWYVDSPIIHYNTITASDNYSIGGAILSLLLGDNYPNGALPVGSRCNFSNLFSNSTTLVNTGKLLLPEPTTSYCYQNMFYHCTGLTTAPVLPATASQGCYQSMFNGCTGLTTAPALPATTVDSQSYQYMFYGCTGLTTCNIPATTIKSSGCSGMFYGCTSLTTAAIAATTLESRACENMFYGCTALTNPPTLYTTDVPTYGYYQMFYNCTNLSVIRTYANTIGTYGTTNWLKNVKTTGTFYNYGTYSYSKNASGKPSGWTLRTS